jgi:Tfp pilus assembly protein FimT
MIMTYGRTSATARHQGTVLPRDRAFNRCRGGYSLMETLLTIFIAQLITGLVVVNVSSATTTEKLNLAGQQVVNAFREARMLAMSTGTTAGVEFDTSAQTVRVYTGSSATTVTDPAFPGGTYLINLTTQPDIAGTTLVSPLITGDTTNPYRVIYSTLGSTANNGSIQLQAGKRVCTIYIPLVGDAYVQ